MTEPKIIICRKCRDRGLRSFVHERAGGTRTLLACFPYYDEKGREHIHDHNRITSKYECSNGHRFKIKSYEECWCGWKSGKDEFFQFEDKPR